MEVNGVHITRVAQVGIEGNKTYYQVTFTGTFTASAVSELFQQKQEER